MTIYESGDRITSPFGKRTLNGNTAMHNGIDDSKGPGSKQRACISGYIEWVSTGYNYGRGNNTIIRQDTKKGIVRIRHQHADKILVSRGQTVKATDYVATEGTSGDVTGSHDHFEVVIGGVLRSDGEISGGTAVNPSPWLGYPNAVGSYARNDKVYDYGTGQYTNDTEDDMKLKIFAPMNKVVSSQMVKEGVVAVMGGDKTLRGYNLAGEARMVREITDATMSATFESMRGEMQPNELMVAVE